MFMGCLVAGIGFALVGVFQGRFAHAVGVIGPLAATLAYPVWGLSTSQHRNAAVRERFADNCYYLGFIFTQLALVVGFLPITLLNRTITSTDILRYFGLALGASLIGLVFRTFITQTGHTVAENMDIVEGEVDALARMVSDRSRKVLNQFETLSASLAESYSAIGTNLDRAADSLEVTMRRFGTAISADISALESESALTTNASAETVRAMAVQQEAFSANVAAAARAIEEVRN